MLSQLSVEGEDFIGLLGFSTDKYALLAPRFPETEALDVPALRTHVYGTSLIGLFCAGNSNGLLLPYFVPDHELGKIKEFLEPLGVEVAKTNARHTSLGNLVAANDKAAIASPASDELNVIEETLDVEVVCMDLSGHVEVGSSLVATNRGFVLNPEAADVAASVSEILGVDGGVGTVNLGVPYPGTGLIANSKGAITGAKTTGIEMGRIDKCLGFL